MLTFQERSISIGAAVSVVVKQEQSCGLLQVAFGEVRSPYAVPQLQSYMLAALLCVIQKGQLPHFSCRCLGDRWFPD